jgi:hypothetical protein
MMSFIVCDADTGEFYKTPGVWVQSAREATVFPDLPCLMRECKQVARLNLAMFTLYEGQQLRSGVRLGPDTGLNFRMCTG